MSKAFVGEPIRPHVELLMESIKPEAGDAYSHRQLADVAGLTYPSARYMAVIGAWKRRLLREVNVDLQSVPSFGYRVLDDNERVGAGIRDFSRSVRSMGKSADRISRADVAKLDDHHRRQQDHAVRLTQQLVASGRSAAKEIGLAGRVVSLPRREVK